MDLKLTSGDNSITVDFRVDDYSLTEVYYNDLKQADNSVSLTVPYSSSLQNFLNAYVDLNIKAVVYGSDNEKIFNGYVRKTFDFGKKQRNNDLKIELVSPTFLLNVDTTSVFTMVGESQTLGQVVNGLTALAGFTTSVAINDSVPVFILEENQNVKTALTELLFEHGYCFDFDSDGDFICYSLFNIPSDLTTITQTFNGNNIRNEVKVQKNEKENDGVRVNWKKYEQKSNLCIFQDTTDSSGAYECVIPLASHEYLASREDDENETTSYYIKYDSTAGEVVYATEASLTVESTNNSGLTVVFTNHGTKGQVSIYNKTSSVITIHKIKVTGKAYVITSEQASATLNSKKVEEINADFIHSSAIAQRLCTQYGNWLKYSDYKVSLQSYSDYAVGSFVKVTENGLGIIYGRIVQKKYNVCLKPISYEIEAISEYTAVSLGNSIQFLTPSIPGNLATIQDVAEIETGADAVPDVITTFTAVAEENGIAMEVTPGSLNLKNSLNGFKFSISRDNGATWSSEYSIKGLKGLYYFNRAIDGFPEESDLLTWKVKVRAVNIYGNQSEQSAAQTVNVSNYGSWTLGAPIVATRTSDRTISLVMNTTRADNKTQYGNTRFKVSVHCLAQGDSENVWYCPATSSNPYPTETEGNESNYKDTDSTDNFVRCDSTWIQTMPLKGQSTNAIVDTRYEFKVVAYNEKGDGTATTTSAVATCTSIRDIVKANETAKEAYISQLSAISANIGVVTGGAMGGADTNHIALSTFTDDNGTKWYKGDVFFGDEDEYFRVQPVIKNGTIDHYEIQLQAGNIALTSSGLDFNSGTYFYDKNNSNRRLHITASGIVIEDKVNGLWEENAKVYVSSKGDMVLTNSSEAPTVGYELGNGKVYHFNSNFTDQNGESTITVASGATITDDSVVENGACMGDISFTDSSIKGLGFWSKSNFVVAKGNLINTDGTTESFEPRAAEWNENASTDWGLTQDQIDSQIFKEW